MKENGSKNLKTYRFMGMAVIAFLSVIMYGLPYISSNYYYPMMNTMGISHTEMGQLLSLYGMGCMLSYLPGGMIGDKLRTKLVIIVSQIGTGTIGLIFANNMSFKVARVLWFLLSFTSCFALWSALGKARRMLVGTDGLGGIGYGILYFGQSILGMGVSSLTLYVFSLFADERIAFKNLVLFISAMQFLSALLTFLFFKENLFDPVEQSDADKFKFEDAVVVFKDKTVWLLSFLSLATYAISCGSYYFTPYLTDIYGIAPLETAGINIIRTYVFVLLSPLGGMLLDKVVKSTAKLYIYICSGLALSFVVLIYLPDGISPLMATCATMLPALIRGFVSGLEDTVFNEARIPLKYTGTAYAVSSLICYTPDLYIYIIFGYFLDTMPGKAGYTAIFMTMIGFAIIGVIACILLRITIKAQIEKLQKLGLTEGLV